MRSTTFKFIPLCSSLFYSVHMHASLHCHVLFICSVIFTISRSRSVDCRRGTDTRKGRREGIRGEGREDRGRKCAHHVNFHETLNQKPPLCGSKCPKTRLQQSKNQTICWGYYSPTRFRVGEGRGGEGKKEEWRVNEMNGYGPHSFSSKFMPMMTQILNAPQIQHILTMRT